MMVFRWVKIALTFLLTINFLSAKEYNLDEIIKLAEEQNKDIKLARTELKTASALKLEAYSDALPKFSVNAGYARNFKENVIYTGAPP
ncbi:MAG: TolC family protein, partial [Calditrichia bacterium]